MADDGLGLEVEAKGLKELRKLFADAQSRLGSMEPVLEVAAEAFKSMTDESFQGSKAPDGLPWKKLAPSTLKQKKRLGYSNKPLVRRGARGLQGATHVTGTKDSIKFGVGPHIPYGGAHQDGRGIVRRAFFPFTPGGTLMKSDRIDKIFTSLAKNLRKFLFPNG